MTSSNGAARNVMKQGGVVVYRLTALVWRSGIFIEGVDSQCSQLRGVRASHARSVVPT